MSKRALDEGEALHARDPEAGLPAGSSSGSGASSEGSGAAAAAAVAADSESPRSPSGMKRARCGGLAPQRTCRVPGCTNRLQPGYSWKYRICDACYRAPRLDIEGAPHRFCQQCSKLHPEDDFDGERRSCRTALAQHQQRRSERQSRASATTAGAVGSPPVSRSNSGTPRAAGRQLVRRASGKAAAAPPPSQQQQQQAGPAEQRHDSQPSHSLLLECSAAGAGDIDLMGAASWPRAERRPPPSRIRSMPARLPGSLGEPQADQPPSPSVLEQLRSFAALYPELHLPSPTERMDIEVIVQPSTTTAAPVQPGSAAAPAPPPPPVAPAVAPAALQRQGACAPARTLSTPSRTLSALAPAPAPALAPAPSMAALVPAPALAPVLVGGSAPAAAPLPAQQAGGQGAAMDRTPSDRMQQALNLLAIDNPAVPGPSEAELFGLSADMGFNLLAPVLALGLDGNSLPPPEGPAGAKAATPPLSRPHLSPADGSGAGGGLWGGSGGASGSLQLPPASAPLGAAAPLAPPAAQAGALWQMRLMPGPAPAPPPARAPSAGPDWPELTRCLLQDNRR